MPRGAWGLSYTALPSPAPLPELSTSVRSIQYVCLARLPSMDSGTSLPNDRYTYSHYLTVLRGTDGAFAVDLEP